MKSTVVSVIVILLCAVPASLASWTLAKWWGLSGVALALVTALLAMVLAVAAFMLLAAVRGLFERTLGE